MKTHHIITALLCAITFSVTAFAVTPGEAKKVYVTISLSNMPVAEVLKYVSQSTNIKTHYAAAKDDAVITVEFKNVPADEVFTYISQRTKLSVTYKDDGVHFAPKK
jgi:type II secretory pathway component GspD/PulD (secretin)